MSTVELVVIRGTALVAAGLVWSLFGAHQTMHAGAADWDGLACL